MAGQNEKYIIKQINDFKSSTRLDPVMNAQVANLSEKTIANIAAFYAQQSMPTGEADPAVVELGEAIYRGGNLTKQITACGACHGPSGAGNPPAGFPQLAGQQAAYTVKQLQAFRTGERANDANEVMRDIAERMSDAEIKAVAEYIRGLRP
ncbi:MAG TPA: cytochrome c4 [Gammaproteobacteria bacterium]|nr:cytochrome c4 [Gammaproteobacteria bacterium]